MIAQPHPIAYESWYLTHPLGAKNGLDKVEVSAGDKSQFIATWSTINIKCFFPLKDRVLQKPFVTYNRKCSCVKTYIEETMEICETGWCKHEHFKGLSKACTTCTQ